MSRLTRVTSVAAAAAAGLVLLTGCSALQSFIGGGDATRDDSGQVVEGNDAADVLSMRVGDCLNDINVGEEVDQVPIVPCSEPHDSEIFSELVLPAGDFPGMTAIEEQAETHCLGAFTEFVGIDYDNSELYFSWYSPTQGSWEGADDRAILCSVYDEAGQTTGTLGGTAR